MKRRLATLAVLPLLLNQLASAQAQRAPGSPMRIVMLVDSSSAMASMITQFRAAMNVFLDELSGEPELMLISTGGQFRVRVGPTTDRQKVRDAVNRFASDSGGNVFVDCLLEADERFLKNAPDRRSVLVIMTTDLLVPVHDIRVELYNRFLNGFLARGGRAHALVVKGLNTTSTTQVAENLVHNSNGFYQDVSIANALPKLMKSVAESVALDQ